MKPLNEIMEFDHVIRVNEDGTVTSAPQDVYAPEVYVDTDDDGQLLEEHEQELIDRVRSQDWELLSGYTGQYSYNGVFMHSSEFIGGGLEKDILSRPGYYVALVVETIDDNDEAAGWVVAFRE